MKKEWLLYMIEAENGFLYTGITKDLERRLFEHKTGKGAKFFRRSPPKEVRLVCQWLTQSQALKIESRVKKLNRNEKEKFISEYQKETRK